ncbi:MAG TPA: hypothetical protein VMM55_13840 [Thermohalobaculum sp.]|nr:hypothetical protein [Thermohalobaculum sp.]
MSNETGSSGSDPKDGNERLRQTAEDARAAAGGRYGEAKRKAGETAGQVRRRAEAEAERGKNRGAGEIHNWASALERAAGELGRDTAQGRAVHAVAEQVDDLARSIENQSVGDMVGKLAAFGRRNPAVLAGGAVLAGFALSRFATARPESEFDHEEDRR